MTNDQHFDNGQAEREGWSVFHVGRSDDWAYEIERIDDPSEISGSDAEPVFANDVEAMRHVLRRADEGSSYHQGAIDFLKEHSPEAWEEMAKIDDAQPSVSTATL